MPADGGLKILPLILKTAGAQTVTVADVSLPSAKGTSNVVTVISSVSPTTDHFKVTGFPSPDVAGVAHSVTITAVNAAGQTITGYTGAVQITSSDPAFQPISVTFSAANKGVVTKTVTLSTTGKQSLTATDGGGKTGSEQSIAVVSPTTHLSVSYSATTCIAGNSVLPVVVTVKGLTGSNTLDTQFADTLQLTTSDPRAHVVAQPIANGTQTFTITFTTAGAQTITVVDQTRPTIAVVVQSRLGIVEPAPKITVSAAAVAQLIVTGLPLFAPANSSQRFTVTAEDLYGNPIVSGFTDTVSVAGQSYPFKAADHGAHVFTTTLGTAGTLPLTPIDTSKPTVPAGSETITIVPASTPMTVDPTDSTKTALVILPPSTGATIVITPTNPTGTSVSVTVNGKAIPGGPFTPTGHIFVYGQSGKNIIEEVANQGWLVAVPAILFAGTGASTLSAAGSSANNILVGGVGADTLTGGSGRDILIGGGGAASLHAGKGDDVLIGGSTIFDNNLNALAAIMAEWSRADLTYNERIDDLFSGGGLNGPYLFNAQTIIAGTASSQFFGGSTAQDWFWLSLNNKKPADKLTGYTTGEVATFE